MKFKKILQKKTKILLSIVLLTLFFLTISYLTTIVFAWVGPTQDPLGGNVTFETSCKNIFSEYGFGLGEVCYEVSVVGNSGSIVPECVLFKQDGSTDAPEFIPDVQGDSIYTQWLSGSLGSLNQQTGIISGVQKQQVEVFFGFGPFGANPGSLNGVSFFDGNNAKGMIVFKTVGTYSVTPSLSAVVEVLVVAGGGGGGDYGGGAGAGGLLYDNAYGLTGSAMTVTVGGGGAGNISGGGRGYNGNDSVSGSLIAKGGGGGGGWFELSGGNGGSGGGAGADAQNAYGTPGTGTLGQGHSGGAAYFAFEPSHGNGGGGGSGAAGGDASEGIGGNGGAGSQYFGFFYSGGGGGLGGFPDSNGSGGVGGGGDFGVAGTPNTGGGAGSSDTVARNGGSGIVIIRWGGYSKNYNPTNNTVWD